MNALVKQMLDALKLALPILEADHTSFLEGCTVGLTGEAADIRDAEDQTIDAEYCAAINAAKSAIAEAEKT